MDESISDLMSELKFDPSEEDIDRGIRRRDALGKALEGTEFGNSVILSGEAAVELQKPHFRLIVDTLQDYDVESVSELAERVGRDKSTVSRHLSTLMKFDVVKLQGEFRKKPMLKHEHVVFEPLY